VDHCANVALLQTVFPYVVGEDYCVEFIYHVVAVIGRPLERNNYRIALAAWME